MNKHFDLRVLPESVLELVRSAQRLVPCHLGGGAALAGAYLGHRRSADIDLFVHSSAEEHRRLVDQLFRTPSAAQLELVRDAGHLVRMSIRTADAKLEADIVHESVADVAEDQPVIDGVVVEALTDLRANKLTCLLSRSEPRDLVDLLFLDRAGFPPEKDLANALRKDAGVDPGILAWLLRSFPIDPLPEMLLPLTSTELRDFRDQLANRLRFLASESK